MNALRSLLASDQASPVVSSPGDGPPVNQPIDLIVHPGVALLRVFLAGLLGGLIGVERERASHAAAEPMFAGVRTFPLFAILGATLTLATGEIGPAVIAGFLAVAGLVLIAYWRSSSSREIGTTTEIAALATYWIGALAHGGTGGVVLRSARRAAKATPITTADGSHTRRISLETRPPVP